MTTRSQLESDVDAWLARDDIATGGSFPSILLLAEAVIADQIRAVAQEKRELLSVTGRNHPVPTDFLQMRYMFVDASATSRHFEYQTPEALREEQTWLTGGRTGFYTIEGGDDTAAEGSPTSTADNTVFTFAPAFDDTTPTEVELYYFKRWTALVNPTDTNWLMFNFYPIYLYSTLRAACEWTQETELEANYQGKYDAAVERFSRAQNRKRRGTPSRQTYGHVRTIV